MVWGLDSGWLLSCGILNSVFNVTMTNTSVFCHRCPSNNNKTKQQSTKILTIGRGIEWCHWCDWIIGLLLCSCPEVDRRRSRFYEKSRLLRLNPDLELINTHSTINMNTGNRLVSLDGAKKRFIVMFLCERSRLVVTAPWSLFFFVVDSISLVCFHTVIGRYMAVIIFFSRAF